MSLGEHDKAREAYRRAMSLGKEHVRVYRDLGVISEEDGRLEEARAHYQRGVEVDPQHAGSHYHLGAVLEKLGETGGVEELYLRAIELDSDHISAHYNLARFYVKEGRREEGRRLMQVFQELKKFEKERKAGERGVAHSPRDPRKAYELGMVYLKYGRQEKAREILQKIAQRDPNFKPAREKLAQIDQGAAGAKGE